MELNDQPLNWPGGATIVAEWEMTAIIRKMKSLIDENDRLKEYLETAIHEMKTKDHLMKIVMKQLKAKDRQIKNLLTAVDRLMGLKKTVKND